MINQTCFKCGKGFQGSTFQEPSLEALGQRFHMECSIMILEEYVQAEIERDRENDLRQAEKTRRQNFHDETYKSININLYLSDFPERGR